MHSEYGASIWADPLEWIPEAARLLRRGGELIFLAPATAETHPYYGYVPAEWARKWPAEEIWKARKRDS